jgi:hypothetical protein
MGGRQRRTFPPVFRQSRRWGVGTYEKSFVVDGEEYELYRHWNDGRIAFQLVSYRGQLVHDGLLSDEPDQEMVEALVRRQQTDAPGG